MKPNIDYKNLMQEYVTKTRQWQKAKDYAEKKGTHMRQAKQALNQKMDNGDNIVIPINGTLVLINKRGGDVTFSEVTFLS